MADSTLVSDLEVELVGAVQDDIEQGRIDIVRNAIAGVLKLHPMSDPNGLSAMLRSVAAGYDIQVTLIRRCQSSVESPGA